MGRKRTPVFILSIFVLLSFIIKLILIFKYNNLLTLDSDDLNYIKSAVVLIRKGIFVFHNYNEPTVFVMPLYPGFLAVVFKILGCGFTGLQAVRIIQAVFSSITIILVYLIGKTLFNTWVALISSFLVSFYFPNIVTVGYLLTETLFMTLLMLLIYLSLNFSRRPSFIKFVLLGIVWAVTTLCRPTIALYPVLLFAYIFLYHRFKIKKAVQLGLAMILSFTIIMAPWWIRNYREYGDFIPLSAASGNPMLQGTYPGYKQNPENIVYYKLGRNAYETNKTEMETAKKRIISEFRKDFWGYLKWYTVDKTYLFWGTIFYWKEFFDIDHEYIVTFHYFILLGFIGIAITAFKNFFKYLLPVLVIVYFNAVHCVYMAFDRYAFPLIPLLSIFFAFFLVVSYRFVKFLAKSITKYLVGNK